MIADDGSLASLMALSQQGDKRAYATLLEEAERWLRRYFARRVPPQHLDDLVQDTLISLHRKRASFDATRAFLPWLAAIARYRWVDHLRRVYRSPEAEFDETLPGADDGPAVTARLSIERLLGLLPRRQAEVITMVKIEGLSVAEASRFTGQSESLVKVNIHRGLKKLQQLVERT